MIETRQTYQSRFETHLQAIESYLETCLAPQEPQVLWDAMRHGVLSGGKRIRPVLLLETCRASGGDLEKALPTACALELIHCFSLIHDDLPCIDNDDMRRGRLTVHKAFSEDMAVLAGDALYGLAFAQITDFAPQLSDRAKLRLLSALAWASSVKGLVNGQVDDIQFAHAAPDEQLLYRIHHGKTGALFRFSTWAGGLIAGQPEPILTRLSRYGDLLGLAFQIVDDLLDVQASADVLGKTPGKDQAQGKMTFPAVFGVAETERILKDRIAALHALLDELDGDLETEQLLYLVGFVEKRES